MMVKDASGTLTAALSPALLALADDIVVLDSGSSDGTPELAASLGARVVRAPFGDGGFGEQQTRAVHASRADWVLVLDADEVASSALLRLLPFLIRTPGVAGWWLPRRWAVDLSGAPAWLQSAPHWPDYQPRLARRLPGLAYTGVIHQTLAPSAPRPWLIARSAPLVHLDLIVNDRATREAKVIDRMGTQGFAGTEGFYLWEDHPSVVTSLPADEQQLRIALGRLSSPDRAERQRAPEE